MRDSAFEPGEGVPRFAEALLLMVLIHLSIPAIRFALRRRSGHHDRRGGSAQA